MTVVHAEYDAVVVGAGPNGLAAAITLARADRSVLLVEANDTVGGGCRSAELTLAGFVHDVCSAGQPQAVASPFMRSVPLAEHGVVFDHAPLPLAHPLDGGIAAALHRDLDATAASLGRDGRAYARLLEPLVRNAEGLADHILGPPMRLPRHPVALAELGRQFFRSAAGLARSTFRDEPARALHAGLAAHTMLPLEQPPTAIAGLYIGLLGHAYGWPVVRGGAQHLADALAAELRRLGGEIETGLRVETLAELPSSDAVLFDLTPRQVLAIAGDNLPSGYRRRLARFRYGPGIFKLDLALDGPVPWTAEPCRRAAFLHVGGTLAEIAAAERAAFRGHLPERPFVLVGQPDLADPTRSPGDGQTLWTYCHVPSGSTVDMTDAIEAQIERFAPGFRDRILARSTRNSAQVEAHDANYVGGDINAGLQSVAQTLFPLGRPAIPVAPYATPDPRLWLCSSSTPPGGGVHGMSGYWAAKAVLRHTPGARRPARVP